MPASTTEVKVEAAAAPSPVDSLPVKTEALSKIDSDVARVSGPDGRFDDSMSVFNAYVREMRSAGKAKDWDAKYRGKTLVLQAIMKKAKIKKGVMTVDCTVNGEGVVVYMKSGESERTLAVAKGDVFYVKGVVAERRFGILHVLGLSDGEIVR